MPNPWVIIGMLVLWVASVVGVGYWQNNAGHVAERVAWQLKENNELRAANAKILQLENAARATEQQHAVDLAAVATKDEQEKHDEISKKDALIAQLRAGTVRLRDPGATAVSTNCGSTGQTPTSTSGSDGSTTGQLSEQLAEFLVNEASMADKVVIELQACQAVIQSDRQDQ